MGQVSLRAVLPDRIGAVATLYAAGDGEALVEPAAQGADGRGTGQGLARQGEPRPLALPGPRLGVPDNARSLHEGLSQEPLPLEGPERREEPRGVARVGSETAYLGIVEIEHVPEGLVVVIIQGIEPRAKEFHGSTLAEVAYEGRGHGAFRGATLDLLPPRVLAVVARYRHEQAPLVIVNEPAVGEQPPVIAAGIVSADDEGQPR